MSAAPRAAPDPRAAVAGQDQAPVGAARAPDEHVQVGTERTWDPMHVGPAGLAHVFLFAVVLPYFAVRSKRHFDDAKELPARTRHFTNAIVQQVLFLAAGVLVARREWIELFPRFGPR